MFYRLSLRTQNTDGDPAFKNLLGWAISWFSTSEKNKRILKVDAAFLEGQEDVSIVLEDSHLIDRLEEIEEIIETEGLQSMDGITEEMKRTTCKDLPLLPLAMGKPPSIFR